MLHAAILPGIAILMGLAHDERSGDRLGRLAATLLYVVAAPDTANGAAPLAASTAQWPWAGAAPGQCLREGLINRPALLHNELPAR
jgi:hypothetical protein